MQKLSIAIGLLLATLFLTGSAINTRPVNGEAGFLYNIEQMK